MNKSRGRTLLGAFLRNMSSLPLYLLALITLKRISLPYFYFIKIFLPYARLKICDFKKVVLYYKRIRKTRFCVPNFALYFVENLDKLLAYYNDDERKRAEKTLLRRVRFILL